MKAFQFASFGVVFSFLLSGCSGHAFGVPAQPLSSGASSTGHRTNFAKPQSEVASGYSAQVFDVFMHEDDTFQHDNGEGVVIVASGQTPPPYSDGTQPVPGGFAQIAYPDGSVQTADGNGTFAPIDSTYAQANASAIEADPDAGVAVTIDDASGKSEPLQTQVQIEQSDGGSNGSGSGPGRINGSDIHVHTDSAAAPTPFAALSMLPLAQTVRNGSVVTLSVAALDDNGHATQLGNSTILWSQPQSGRIVPLGNGATALYYAPKHGSGVDTFTASLSGSPSILAGGAVAHLGASQLTRVTATLAAPAGFAAPGSRIGFAQTAGLPAPVFSPATWYAHATADGFEGRVPAAGSFAAFLTHPGSAPMQTALSSGGSASTWSPGSGPANFTAPQTSSAFVAPAGVTIPAISQATRDAYFVSAALRERNLFDADSGLQKVLAAPFAPARGTIATGEFNGWAFEWQNPGGPATLVLEGAANSADRNLSAAVTPAGDGATYAFSRYRSSTAQSNGYPLAPGGELLEDGAWSQGIDAGSYGASLEVNYYDPNHQAAGSPLYTLRGTASEVSGTVAFRGVTLYDARGFAVWTLDASRGVANSVNGVTHFDYSGQAANSSPNSTGAALQRTFTLSGYGAYDGSSKAVLNAKDGSLGVVLQIAGDGSGRGSAGGAAGRLATMTLQNDAFSAVVGADSGSGYAGTPLDFTL